jgi:S-adenosylmethionine:tRNA ribosyltransferase-isomerase
MDTGIFDYHLPKELIAQEPLPCRDSSRLLVVDRQQLAVDEDKFSNILKYINSGDCLVLNNTKVIPARVYATKESGARVEFLFLEEVSGGLWRILAKPSKRLKPGALFFVDSSHCLKIVSRNQDGSWLVKCMFGGLRRVLETHGYMPTPPYIKQELKNKQQYQTIYAKEEGAIAAPTAGLHFTQELLRQVKERGVEIVYITLHVGVGTFKPVKTRVVENHKMQSERFTISGDAASVINQTRKRGKKVVAVGTTVMRALESMAKKQDSNFYLTDGSGSTDIFIYPPYKFKMVDAVITNFHLPCSTNLIFVSAFAGIELIKKAYQQAINNRFRFYSFGDAMIIL